MKQVNLRVCRMILPLLFGLFLSLSAYAQQVSVKGHVKDSTGEPVIGANVVVKDNSSIGTITESERKLCSECSSKFNSCNFFHRL